MSDPTPTLESLDAKLDALLAALSVTSSTASPAPKGKEAPRFVDIEGSAAYISHSTKSVRRLIDAGKLTALRPCKGKIVIDRQQLDAYVLSASQRVRTGRGRSR